MRVLLLLLTTLVVTACPSTDTARQPEDAAQRRARDSAIGASNLPGAQGVRGAIRAADSSAARQAARDSLERTP